MPYYIRTNAGEQIYGAAIDALPALSVRVDAELVRAPFADTWQAAGDGRPVAVDASIVLYATDPTPPTWSGITGVGYEAPDGVAEWERPVLGWRGVRIVNAGSTGAVMELRLALAPVILLVSRWVTSDGDTMSDHTGATMAFSEEV